MVKWFSIALSALIILPLTGCSVFGPLDQSDGTTNGRRLEAFGGTGYQPVDPIPLEFVVGDDGPMTSEVLLKGIPSDSMRLAVAKVTSTGDLNFGPAAIGVSGETYTVILDYIKYSSARLEVTYFERQDARDIHGGLNKDRARSSGICTSAGHITVDSMEEYGPRVTGSIAPTNEQAFIDKSATANIFEATHQVPVYVGIGLRIRATVSVIDGSVNLTSLFGLGAAAEANRVRGSLIIQTLGISGPEVSSAIPLPGELNATTVQNAIQAIATIKSKIYDDQTTIAPQVVGFDNPYAIQGAATLLLATIYSSPISVHLTNAGVVTFELKAAPVKAVPQEPAPDTVKDS